MQVIKKINLMYDKAESNLKKQYQLDRSNLSAQSAISKSNTATALMQKGLSKSGESVQSSIMSDMAYMGALTQLANNNAQKINELNVARQSAIADVQNDMLNAQNEADRQDAQFEYQKERDKVSDDKWQSQQEYQAQKDQRDFEYTRERDSIKDERTERELAREIYESDRDYQFDVKKHEDEKAQTSIENAMENTKIYHENYIKSQYLELEKEKNSQKTDSQSGDLGFGYSVNSKGYIVPDVSPDKFLDIMLKGNGVGAFRGVQFVSPNEFEKRVRAMLKENRLDPDYLNLMEIYARGRGIIRDDLE